MWRKEFVKCIRRNPNFWTIKPSDHRAAPPPQKNNQCRNQSASFILKHSCTSAGLKPVKTTDKHVGSKPTCQQCHSFQTYFVIDLQFLADHTLVKVKLLSWMSSYVCLSVRPSVHHGCIVAKRCKIGLRLLLITNRKLHTAFQMTYKLMTLDDFEGS